MALPKVEVPTYELEVPSTDEKLKYRPFLVKEEKILLMALESQDNAEMMIALKEIVKACTFEKFDTDKAPLFDLEYIFLNIRAKSIGEKSEFKVLCPDDKKTYAKVEIDLTEVNVEVDDDHTNKVIIDKDKNLGVVLKYPSLALLHGQEDVDTASIETVFNTLLKCVDHIFEGEKIYPGKDSTTSELQEFFEALPQEKFLEIKKFFDTMPKVRYETEVTNPTTGVKSKVVFSGLADFFESASPTIA